MAHVAYHPSVPRHHQIQRVLRAQIESGEWGPDGRIPTEMALVRRFRVSRTTIREALRSLTRDGLIVRHRGRGSFVAAARAAPVAPAMVANLFFGYRAEIRVVAAAAAAAPAHVAAALHVPRGSPVRRFVRVEVVKGAPLAVVVNWMVEDIGARIRARDLTQTSMLELLSDRLGIRLGVIRQQIEAGMPDEEIAELLDIDLTQPVLLLRLLVPDASGRRIQVCDTFYRADRYRHELDLRLPARRARPQPGHPIRVTLAVPSAAL